MKMTLEELQEKRKKWVAENNMYDFFDGYWE